jgi:hypothetical protein
MPGGYRVTPQRGVSGSTCQPVPEVPRGSKKMQFSGQSKGTAWAMSSRQRSMTPPGVVLDE